MDSLALMVLMFIALEFFEIRWQKAQTMMQMLANMYTVYRKNILSFFILHPTYYFAIWLMLDHGLSVASILLLFIKTIDVAMKLVLIQQIFDKKEISQEMLQMLTRPLKPWMPYIGLAIYPPLVIFTIL